MLSQFWLYFTINNYAYLQSAIKTKWKAQNVAKSTQIQFLSILLLRCWSKSSRMTIYSSTRCIYSKQISQSIVRTIWNDRNVWRNTNTEWIMDHNIHTFFRSVQNYLFTHLKFTSPRAKMDWLPGLEKGRCCCVGTSFKQNKLKHGWRRNNVAAMNSSSLPRTYWDLY